MRRRPASRLVTLLTTPVTAALLMVSSAPATAEELPPPLDGFASTIGTGSVEFYYEATTNTIRVQVDGDVDEPAEISGTWTLTIAGTRGGVPFTMPLWSSTAVTVVDHKTWVPRVATTGEFTVDWAYTGATGNALVHLVHQVAWTPQTGNVTAGSGAGL